jgi:hypothetical protein
MADLVAVSGDSASLVSVTGPKGDKGDTGKSAYQHAVDNGFVGTESAWLASLVGETGSVGANGSSVLVGSAPPVLPSGAGDVYINTATGDVYKWIA